MQISRRSQSLRGAAQRDRTYHTQRSLDRGSLHGPPLRRDDDFQRHGCRPSCREEVPRLSRAANVPALMHGARERGAWGGSSKAATKVPGGKSIQSRHNQPAVPQVRNATDFCRSYGRKRACQDASVREHLPRPAFGRFSGASVTTICFRRPVTMEPMCVALIPSLNGVKKDGCSCVIS
jgi:hypothetical protein